MLSHFAGTARSGAACLRALRAPAFNSSLAPVHRRTFRATSRIRSEDAEGLDDDAISPEGTLFSGYIWGKDPSFSAANNTMVNLDPLDRGNNIKLRPELKPCPDQSGYRQISFGPTHHALLCENGSVYTFGKGEYYELGNGTKVKAQDKPTKVEGLGPVKQVECGKHHTIALTEDGEVYTWGWGGSFFTSGALGHGDSHDCPTPRRVEALADETIVQVASGTFHCLALTEDGRLYSWGQGEHGRLGHGGSGNLKSPQLMEAFGSIRVNKVVCGSSFNAAITEDGNLYMWGRNDAGQLGCGGGLLDMYNMELAPVRIAGLGGETTEEELPVIDVACGYRHTLAVTEDNRVYMWGQRQWMQPRLVTGDQGVNLKRTMTSVAAGKNFSAAVDNKGQLWTWGSGKSACLGHGDKKVKNTPTRVAGFGMRKSDEFGPVVAVSAGYTHLSALVAPDLRESPDESDAKE